MAQQKMKVGPDICAYVDDQHEQLTIEITIPGVARKNIDLKMHEDSFDLSASTKEVEYVAAYSFCCPVKPDKAEAAYNNGLLTI